MATERNRATLAAVFEGLAVGDGRAFIDAMAEDFTWIMYRGKRGDLSDVARPAAKLLRTNTI